MALGSDPDETNGRRKLSEQASVSLRDVASAAGVSVATASLAMGARPGVAKATAKRVRAVAEELGYKPHPYVTSLMKQVGRRKRPRTKVNLAWLQYGRMSFDEEINLPYGNKPTYLAALRRAQELGYNSLEPYWISEPGVSLGHISKMLKSRGVYGAIVNGTLDKIPKLSELSDVTLVKLSAPLLDSTNHHIYPDAYQGVTLACSQLWRAGYRRICLLLGVRVSVVHVGNIEAAWHNFQQAIPEDLRIPPLVDDILAASVFHSLFENREPTDYVRPPSFIDSPSWRRRLRDIRKAYQKGDASEEEVKAAIIPILIKTWLEQYHPDAIICGDSRLPDVLRSFGYRIPEDIGVAHYNLSKAPAEQDWSGVNRHWDKIGDLAMDTLDHLISTGQFGQSRHPILRAVPGTWVEGQTTRKHEPPVYPKDRYVERWITERADANRQG